MKSKRRDMVSDKSDAKGAVTNYTLKSNVLICKFTYERHEFQNSANPENQILENHLKKM